MYKDLVESLSTFQKIKLRLFPAFQERSKEFGLSDDSEKHVSLDWTIERPFKRLCNSLTADTSLENVVGTSIVRLISCKVVIRMKFSMAS